jgi:hypothetical protein
MTSTTALRRASVMFCLATVLLSGCGRNNDDRATWRAPPAAAEPSAPEAIPDSTTDATTEATTEATSSRHATRTTGPRRSVVAAPGAPRPDRDDPRAPGAPQPERSKQKAAGAPIRIPARLNDEGKPLDAVLARIRSSIRDQCGGTLCVTLDVRYTDPDRLRCEFQRTEPPQQSMVPRGSTVKVIAGRDPCGTETSDTPSPSVSSSSPSP